MCIAPLSGLQRLGKVGGLREIDSLPVPCRPRDLVSTPCCGSMERRVCDLGWFEDNVLGNRALAKVAVKLDQR